MYRWFVLLAAVCFGPNAWAVSVDRAANDAARFLGGLPGVAGSPYLELESDPAWVDHKAKLDDAFQRNSGRHEKIKEFARLNVAPVAKAKNCFYPFGGADSWNVYSFFPDCQQYVMIGLEPAGTMSFADSFLAKKGEMAVKLGGFRTSLATVVEASFFVTKEMDRDFRGQRTDGLLIPLMVLLVRNGVNIEKVEYLQLLDNGSLIPRDPKDKTITNNRRKVVEIHFKKPGAAQAQRLRFFTANLGPTEDYGTPLQFNTGLLLHLDTLGRVNTFLKATSYMPHRPEFTLIRNNILTRSDVVLQEDTGIPFKYFKADEWDVVLFGAYTPPIQVFRGYLQKDLREAYGAEGRAKPLTFPIGYGSKSKASGLQLAIRKK